MWTVSEEMETSMSVYAILANAIAALGTGMQALLNADSLIRRRKFSLDDRKFGDAVLANLDDEDLQSLLEIGTWQTLPAGTVLTEQGKPVENLVFLSLGKT